MLSFTSRRPWSRGETFLTDSYLLITAGTFQKRPYIGGDDHKAMLLESLDFNAYKWKWRLIAYVILDNHYHLIVQTPQGDMSRLAHIIQSAHSFSAHHWRQENPSIHSRIWWNFWETVIDQEHHLHKLINYVHENCRFHGLTERPESYAFSSYREYLAADASAIHSWEAEYPPTDLELIDSF